MKTLMRFSALLAVLTIAVFVAGCSKTSDSKKAADDAAAPAAAKAKAVEAASFADPDTAVTAFVTALRASDRATMAKLFGVDADNFVPPPDIDQADIDKFLADYDQKHHLVTGTPGKAILAVGANDWEFPVPLAQAGGKWTFDIAAGREAMALRRIGRNELAVIQTALAYYDAQEEYATKDRNGDGILEYAQKIASTEGQKEIGRASCRERV